MSFTHVVILNVANLSFNAFRENEVLAKMSEFTVPGSSESSTIESTFAKDG